MARSTVGCLCAQAPKLKLTPRHIRSEPRASHMPTARIFLRGCIRSQG